MHGYKSNEKQTKQMGVDKIIKNKNNNNNNNNKKKKKRGAARERLSNCQYSPRNFVAVLVLDLLHRLIVCCQISCRKKKKKKN